MTVTNHPTQEQLTRAARMLKAIAHPLRIRILLALEAGERTVSELIAATGAKPALTSQQLGLMRDRGVLAARRDGAHVYYRIANEHVLTVVNCVRNCCETGGGQS